MANPQTATASVLARRTVDDTIDLQLLFIHHRDRVDTRLSASPCGFDRRDVDLFHRHHRVEGAFGFGAAGREGVGQDARGDLPGQAPAIFAPAAVAFLAAVVDD